jgi:DNA ligase-4
VFDIVYLRTLDGVERDLMSVPLFERKLILEKTVKNAGRRLEVVDARRVTGTKAVIDEFNTCLMNNDEGIIVKQVDTPYIPDNRSVHWLKLKADYFEGLGDSLDVLIVGGLYGSGFRSRSVEATEHITVFLVAVASRIDLKNPS